MINVTFSKYVKMTGRLWEVNFRKLSRGTNLFYADTATLQGERISFEVQMENGSWTIKGMNVPAWIRENEQNIGSAIQQGMQEHFPQLSSAQFMETAG
jgi:hypothetical protein